MKPCYYMESAIEILLYITNFVEKLTWEIGGFWKGKEWIEEEMQDFEVGNEKLINLNQ